MFIKSLLSLIVWLTLVGSVMACQNNAPHAASPLISSNAAMSVQRRSKDAVSVVKAYNSAVQRKDLEKALGLLSYDIVLVDLKPAPCTSEVFGGMQTLEGLLESSKILSFSVGDWKVEGNKVNYALSEWFDPRIVGPNYPQPRHSHLIAVVENGEIVSITATRDRKSVALYGQGAQDEVCG